MYRPKYREHARPGLRFAPRRNPDLWGCWGQGCRLIASLRRFYGPARRARRRNLRNWRRRDLRLRRRLNRRPRELRHRPRHRGSRYSRPGLRSHWRARRQRDRSREYLGRQRIGERFERARCASTQRRLAWLRRRRSTSTRPAWRGLRAPRSHTRDRRLRNWRGHRTIGPTLFRREHYWRDRWQV